MSYVPKPYFWSRIGSPWLGLGSNLARMNPTASRNLFKPLPALREPISGPKYRKQNQGSAAWAEPLNAPRRGSATPSTACQITRAVRRTPCKTNAMPTAMPNALQRLRQTFMTKVTKSFQRSALQPLTQCLRGEGDPWETLPLNNPPLLTALEITTWPTYCFPTCF